MQISFIFRILLLLAIQASILGRTHLKPALSLLVIFFAPLIVFASAEIGNGRPAPSAEIGNGIAFASSISSRATDSLQSMYFNCEETADQKKMKMTVFTKSSVANLSGTEYFDVSTARPLASYIKADTLRRILYSQIVTTLTSSLGESLNLDPITANYSTQAWEQQDFTVRHLVLDVLSVYQAACEEN